MFMGWELGPPSLQEPGDAAFLALWTGSAGLQPSGGRAAAKPGGCHAPFFLLSVPSPQVTSIPLPLPPFLYFIVKSSTFSQFSLLKIEPPPPGNSFQSHWSMRLFLAISVGGVPPASVFTEHLGTSYHNTVSQEGRRAA